MFLCHKNDSFPGQFYTVYGLRTKMEQNFVVSFYSKSKWQQRKYDHTRPPNMIEVNGAQGETGEIGE